MVDAVNDISEVVVIYDFHSQVYMNVFGFLTVTAGTGASGLANAFKTALVKNTSGGLLYTANPDLTTIRLLVRDVVPGTDADYELAYASVAGGGTGTEPLPPQSAAVINWKTGLAGRSYHGRTFLTGQAEANQNAGSWLSAHVTNLTTIPTQMLAVFGAGGTNGDFRFSIISRVNNGAPRVPPIATQVTTGTVRPTVYNQRRRTIGVGR